MKRALLFLLCCWLCLQAGPAQASESAWVIPRGGTYAEWRMGYGFDPNQSLQQLAFMPHLELGILETASLILEAPFYTRLIPRSDGSEGLLINNGLTDLFLGTRVKLLEEPFALALTGGFKVPTGYDPRWLPVIGERQLDLQLGLNAGYMFYPLEAYVQGGAGYRLRTAFDTSHALAVQNPGVLRPADQLLFFAEGGAWVTPQLFAALQLRGEMAVTSGAEILPQSEVYLSPLLAWRLTPAFDLSLQLDQALWAQNRPFLTQFVLGGHLRFGQALERGKGLRGSLPPDNSP